MSLPGEPLPDQEFARKSELGSVCMYCLQAIQTDRYTPLGDREDIHADVCLHKPRHPVTGYVLF